MVVGGYSLHLYCDGPRHREMHPNQIGSLDAEFAGPNEADCMRQARARGWRFDRDRYRCVCKECADTGERP